MPLDRAKVRALNATLVETNPQAGQLLWVKRRTRGGRVIPDYLLVKLGYYGRTSTSACEDKFADCNKRRAAAERREAKKREGVERREHEEEGGEGGEEEDEEEEEEEEGEEEGEEDGGTGVVIMNAHRLLCWALHGPPPSSRPLACHRCHNKGCLNPLHLFWGDAVMNAAR